jgi:hypothetical protein
MDVQSYNQFGEKVEILASADSLDLTLRLTASHTDPVVVAAVSIRNTGLSDHGVSDVGARSLVVRAVFPKLKGLVAAGDWSQNMGMIPQEIGIVAPLHLAPASAHVAPIMRNGTGSTSCGQQHDIFVIGNDGAVWTQFECNDGPWGSPIRLSRGSLAPPGADVAAVRRNEEQEDAFVIANDGAVWTSREVMNGPFNTIRIWDGAPITAPPGGGIAAVVRNDHQEDIFFVGDDGAIWSSSEVDAGPFSQPVAMTGKGFAPPGAHITALMRNSVQEDIFVIDNGGILQTMFFNGVWNGPAPLVVSLQVIPGGSITAIARNAHQEDVFVIGKEGSIWTTFERNDGPWALPIRLADPGLAPLTSRLAAIRRNDHQEDLFWMDYSGRLETVFEAYDGPWSQPIGIGPSNLARPGAQVAAIMRNDQQEDVYVVGLAGDVVTLFEVNDSAFIGPVPLPFPDPIGKKVNINVGLPNSMNTMEVASIHDPAGGGGLFLADISGDLEQGIAPLQFTLSAGEVVAFWTGFVPAGATLQVPSLAIGVTHNGDWHPAVDFYVRNSPAQQHATVSRPAWFDNVGAIYSHTGMGAGSIYLELGGITLSERLTSFLNLQDVLTDANQLNTNIVYLLDYWDGASYWDGTSCKPTTNQYLDKGDYVPRSDLGGEAALITGITDIHNRAGHVIMYLEPFIISMCSKLATTPLQGTTLGELWAARDPLDRLYGSPQAPAGGYVGNYSMVAPFKPWQDFISGVAKRLVGQYGVDGVFLDSYAWQMNWPVHNSAEGRNYSPLEDSSGVLSLTDRIRQGIQQLNPEAIVLGETTSGPIGKHWDGGLGAEFATSLFSSAEYTVGRILASPSRYGAPDVHYFSNGHGLNELNQVFAAGQGLALCCNSNLSGDSNSFIHTNASYIANLVKWRQDYGDALIQGRQRYQPLAENAAVAAYSYLGRQNRIVTIVNTSVGPYNGWIQLDPEDARFSWINLATNQILASDATGHLHLEIPPGGLIVLKAGVF